MRFHTKYRILLWKNYFDTGFGLLNYFKYFIGFYALASREIAITLWAALIFAVFCFFFGYFYYKYDWVRAQNEVSNRYNLFVEEMRLKIKSKNI